MLLIRLLLCRFQPTYDNSSQWLKVDHVIPRGRISLRMHQTTQFGKYFDGARAGRMDVAKVPPLRAKFRRQVFFSFSSWSKDRIVDEL
jgi:hypothetical protein